MVLQNVYYYTTLIVNSRVLLILTETVYELPGYPIRVIHLGVSFFEGGCRQWGNNIWYCVNGMPQNDTLDSVAYTCMLLYPIDVFHLSFNFLCLLLLYSVSISVGMILIPVTCRREVRWSTSDGQESVKGIFSRLFSIKWQLTESIQKNRRVISASRR